MPDDIKSNMDGIPKKTISVLGDNLGCIDKSAKNTQDQRL